MEGRHKLPFYHSGHSCVVELRRFINTSFAGLQLLVIFGSPPNPPRPYQLLC